MTHNQREALHAWPNWVDNLRKDGYRVATNGTRERLAIPWEAGAAYMYLVRGVKRTGEGCEAHEVVTYYLFTVSHAPQRFDQDIWR